MIEKFSSQAEAGLNLLSKKENRQYKQIGEPENNSVLEKFFNGLSDSLVHFMSHMQDVPDNH
jgi:hypothetical protein